MVLFLLGVMVGSIGGMIMMALIVSGKNREELTKRMYY